jgi:hypothetical protein
MQQESALETYDDTFDDDFGDDFSDHRVKRPGLLVLMAGVGTSVATLAMLYVLNIVSPDLHVMGWYANGIIPIGAMLVGLIAGSGYGIASWFTGAKIGKGLLFQIVLLQLLVYMFSQYVHFLVITAAFDNVPFSFWEFFDREIRAFAWNNDGQPGEPFGIWGYGMLALEMAGFSLCAMIAPAILFAVPYCEACQIYMKSTELGLLPAGIAPRKIKKKDTEGQQAYEEELKLAMESGQKRMETLLESVNEKDPRQFVDLLSEHADNKKAITKQTSRLAVSLEHCKQCQAGRVVLKLQTGFGENQTITELARIDVEPEFTRDVISFRKR